MILPARPGTGTAQHILVAGGETRKVRKAIKEYSYKAEEYYTTLQSLGPAAGIRLIRDMMFSLNHYYVLGRNLAAPVFYPMLKKPEYPFLPIDGELLPTIKRQLDGLDPTDRREMLSRLHFHACGFRNCYAMKDGADIAYLQWIIFPEENGVISTKFKGRFYPLSEKQVMVENVFTFPRYRGRGLLPFGTLQLLELAKERGYGHVICYIRKDNIPSLNEFCKMGFKIVKLVKEYKVFGRIWRTL